ncbi:MAG: UTP--glucose-1-phosphate uridylyltransferase, partial [Planctomycetota bacterium]
MSLDQRYAAVNATLESVGQAHVLKHCASLDDTAKASLLAECEGIDWPEVARLIESHVKQKPEFKLSDDIQPAPWYPYVPTAELQSKYDRARTLGEKMVGEGKVAAFTVAGGQGTRLGWDGPKGTFPATPIRGTTLFACFAEYLHKIEAKFGQAVPWYVMTSPINDGPTRAFFEESKHFGLDPANIMIFPQAMMP